MISSCFLNFCRLPANLGLVLVELESLSNFLSIRKMSKIDVGCNLGVRFDTLTDYSRHLFFSYRLQANFGAASIGVESLSS